MKRRKEQESFDTYMELVEHRREKRDKEEANKRMRKSLVAISETIIYIIVFFTLGYNLYFLSVANFFLRIEAMLLVLMGNIVILAIMAHSFFKNFAKYDEDK